MTDSSDSDLPDMNVAYALTTAASTSSASQQDQQALPSWLTEQHGYYADLQLAIRRSLEDQVDKEKDEDYMLTESDLYDYHEDEMAAERSHDETCTVTGQPHADPHRHKSHHKHHHHRHHKSKESLVGDGSASTAMSPSHHHHHHHHHHRHQHSDKSVGHHQHHSHHHHRHNRHSTDSTHSRHSSSTSSKRSESNESQSHRRKSIEKRKTSTDSEHGSAGKIRKIGESRRNSAGSSVRRSSTESSSSRKSEPECSCSKQSISCSHGYQRLISASSSSSSAKNMGCKKSLKRDHSMPMSPDSSTAAKKAKVNEGIREWIVSDGSQEERTREVTEIDTENNSRLVVPPVLTRNMTNTLKCIMAEGRSKTRWFKNRTMWDKTIYDPEFSDSDVEISKKYCKVDLGKVGENVSEVYMDTSGESSQKLLPSPVISVPKLDLRPNDSVILKNLEIIRRRFSQLSPARVQDGEEEEGEGESDGGGSGWSTPRQKRHFLDGLDAESKGVSSFTDTVDLPGSQEPWEHERHREEEATEKDYNSPLKTAASSVCNESGGLPAPVVRFPHHPGYGPHKLRRLPRVASTQDSRPSVLLPTSSTKETGTGLEYRQLLRQDKNKQPVLFSAQSTPNFAVVQADKLAQQCTVSKVHVFTKNMENTVEGNLEEDWRHKVKGVMAADDLTSTTNEPSCHLLKHMVELLMEAPTKQDALNFYHYLTKLVKLHPRYKAMPFSFELLEQAVCLIHLDLGVHQAKFSQAFSAILAVKFMVDALESDMLQRSLASQNQLFRSVVYRWFCSHGAFHRVKLVIEWLIKALNYGQYNDLSHSYLRILPGSSQQTRHNQVDAQDLPKVFPIIERLLELSLAVHEKPEEFAARMVVELKSEYLHFTSTFQKRMLLTKLPYLLRFKLAQRILEDNCNAENYASHMYTLEDLLPVYFASSIPPRCSLSLPLSPAESGTDSPPPSPPQPQSAWSADSAEELVLLIWTVLDSYIQYNKGRLHLPTCKRVLGGHMTLAHGTLPSCDLAMIRRLPEFVSDLRERLKDRTQGKELSPRTEIFLVKLVCLADH